MSPKTHVWVSNVCVITVFVCVCLSVCDRTASASRRRVLLGRLPHACVWNTPKNQSMSLAGSSAPPHLVLSAVHVAHSSQNVEQRTLHSRFERILRASSSSSIPLFSRTLRLAPDDGNDEHFQSKNWYDALVQKTSLWAEAAEQHPGQLILACDNDITLLPGWDTAVMAAAASLGPEMDLIFQREGGDDPFFDSIPYNSGFFLMRGSHRVAEFWRDVSRRTAVERPFAGDQTIVNSLLHQRGTAAGRPACSAEIALRHAHFPSRLVRGGPTIPESVDALMDVKVHHATASGSAAGKLIALDAFLDAWLNATSHTRARFGWPERGASWLH